MQDLSKVANWRRKKIEEETKKEALINPPQKVDLSIFKPSTFAELEKYKAEIKRQDLIEESNKALLKKANEEQAKIIEKREFQIQCPSCKKYVEYLFCVDVILYSNFKPGGCNFAGCKECYDKTMDKIDSQLIGKTFCAGGEVTFSEQTYLEKTFKNRISIDDYANYRLSSGAIAFAEFLSFKNIFKLIFKFIKSSVIFIGIFFIILRFILWCISLFN